MEIEDFKIETVDDLQPEVFSNATNEVISLRDLNDREKIAIIKEVRRHPVLWDAKDKNYPPDPNLLKNEWMEVAKAVSSISRPISSRFFD